MTRVADARALLFVGDFAVELARYPREFGDHQLDLADAPPLLFELKSFEPDQRVPRLHSRTLQGPATCEGGKALEPTTTRRCDLGAGKFHLSYRRYPARASHAGDKHLPAASRGLALR